MYFKRGKIQIQSSKLSPQETRKKKETHSKQKERLDEEPKSVTKKRKKKNSGENQRPEVSSGEGNGTPLQYFCLENPMDGGAW